MSGDHNRYQKPDYVDRRQWKYDPMTGEPLGAGREPEPVAWMRSDKGHIDLHKHPDYIPLYTAPPQREWQRLTDEEVRDLWSWAMTAEAERTANTQQHAFARAFEAKLKEKNT